MKQHDLVIDEQYLWGHSRGREHRAKIESALEAVPPGECLRIQLKQVETMDFSFSSEVFGRMYRSLPIVYPGRAVALANASDYLKGNLNAALEALGLMALTLKGARTWDIIGKVGETDRATLAAVAKRKQATAPQIAEDLDIKLTACNQRLRKLADAGAVIRTKMSASSGGEQYLYTWPL